MMGRSRYRICEEKAPHFLTCTVLNWIPLFTRPQTVGIVLNALRYRQEEIGWKIYGYVILENHLHMIVQAENLAMELPHFKSYTARKLIDHLKECRAERLLQQLAFFRKDHNGIEIINAGRGIASAAYRKRTDTPAKIGLYPPKPGETGICGRTYALAIFQR